MTKPSRRVQGSPLLIIAASLALAFTSSGCLFASVVVPAPYVEGAAELRHRTYHFGADFDPRRHQANIYLPAGPGPHPVVVFVHGGWWMEGDPNGTYGIYRRLGRRLAARGFVTVVPGYRLAPQHRFPAQIRDVARAIAWTREHAEGLGGDPRAIFAMGHSAGAHLVALAALDPEWLAAEGTSPEALAGVIAISGPYDVPDLATANEIKIDRVFGSDRDRWRRASPPTYLDASRSRPPFLVALASEDPPVLRRAGRSFADALQRVGADLEEIDLPGRTHASIVVELGGEGDPLAAKIERFITEHTRRSDTPRPVTGR